MTQGRQWIQIILLSLSHWQARGQRTRTTLIPCQQARRRQHIMTCQI
jgi:hypothetical protein